MFSSWVESMFVVLYVISHYSQCSTTKVMVCTVLSECIIIYSETLIYTHVRTKRFNIYLYLMLLGRLLRSFR